VSNKLTIADFIERSVVIHGNKYNYSKSNYIGKKNKICIICPDHGEFWQIASDHYINGSGCPKCKFEKLSDLYSHDNETFVDKASKLHSNKYDYSKVEYVNCHTKVCIICPEHGEFWQTPINHAKNNKPTGCPYCKPNYKSNKEKFVLKANKVHDEKYTYDNFIYIRAINKSWITCFEHGDFLQTAHKHLLGQGCPSCSNSKLESFVEKRLREEGIKYFFELS
jgi:hypothetical protein